MFKFKTGIVYGKDGGGGGTPVGGGATTQTSEPWEPQQQWLKYGFQGAYDRMLQTNPQYYPNSTVVPYSPETLQSMELTKQRALAGSPITTSAKNQLTSTMRGDYLYGGPGFDAALNAAMNKAKPGIDSQFELSGRYGSGLHQTARDQAFADAFAGQYGSERQNQLNAMMYAPQIAEADYNDYGKLASVGAQKESLQQEQIADQAARWDFQQNVSQRQLQNYMNLIQGNYGGTSQGTTSGQQMYRNDTSSGIGGVLGLASTAAQIFTK